MICYLNIIFVIRATHFLIRCQQLSAYKVKLNKQTFQHNIIIQNNDNTLLFSIILLSFQSTSIIKLKCYEMFNYDVTLRKNTQCDIKIYLWVISTACWTKHLINQQFSFLAKLIFNTNVSIFFIFQVHDFVDFDKPTILISSKTYFLIPMFELLFSFSIARFCWLW